MKLVFFYSENYRIFSLVTDTIYIFIEQNKAFLAILGLGFYQKVLNEEYL